MLDAGETDDDHRSPMSTDPRPDPLLIEEAIKFLQQLQEELRNPPDELVSRALVAADAARTTYFEYAEVGAPFQAIWWLENARLRLEVGPKNCKLISPEIDPATGDKTTVISEGRPAFLRVLATVIASGPGKGLEAIPVSGWERAIDDWPGLAAARKRGRKTHKAASRVLFDLLQPYGITKASTHDNLWKAVSAKSSPPLMTFRGFSDDFFFGSDD